MKRLPLVLLMGLGFGWPAVAQPDDKVDAAKAAKKVARAKNSADQAEDERKALRHFHKEIADYAELHAKQLARLSRHLAGDAQQASAEQQALATAIAAKRSRALPGDVFQPEVEPLFRRLIAEQLVGPDAADARKSVQEGNPAAADEDASVPVVLEINAVYPSGAPRSTVPPSVLLTLPELPDALHYRFVGRDLILVDSVAQLIVDFIPDAAPVPAP
jgi:hypothetical protein